MRHPQRSTKPTRILREQDNCIFKRTKASLTILTPVSPVSLQKCIGIKVISNTSFSTIRYHF